jgi:hypothetical protein
VGVGGGPVVPWRRIALSSSVESEGYALRTTLDAPARLGTLASALPAGEAEGRILKGQVIEVDLAFGGLASVSRLSLLNGANAAAILSDAGIWEVVQFELAEEISSWPLAAFKPAARAGRNRRRDACWRKCGQPVCPHRQRCRAAGADARGSGPDAQLDRRASRFGNKWAVPQLFAGGERALTPLSPVHLTARREAGGIRFRWIRRGRLQADSWAPAEIADDEGFERYRAEILLGGASIRTAELESPEWLYTDAEELADFGAEQTELTLRVAQAGKRVPWGIARTATLSL